MGDFIYDAKDFEFTIYMWGVGSGITPLYSLIKEIIKTRPCTKIVLVYGNKYKETTIFSNQLIELQETYKSNFKLYNFFSQEKVLDEKEGFVGRISSCFVLDLVSQNTKCKETLHYICGPSGLKETVKNALIELSIPLSSIFLEDFELVIDPKELECVEDCRVEVDFQGVLSEIFVPKGKTILDIALDNNIEIPYSCQTGNCNTCKAELKYGQLKMIGLNEERKNLAQNEFLLCCSYPLTNLVSLKLI
jgi:ring-1,2-phenylacetyl-CoA epoxidase subunit PaaE